jgi:hypothetical protein
VVVRKSIANRSPGQRDGRRPLRDAGDLVVMAHLLEERRLAKKSKIACWAGCADFFARWASRLLSVAKGARLNAQTRLTTVIKFAGQHAGQRRGGIRSTPPQRVRRREMSQTSLLDRDSRLLERPIERRPATGVKHDAFGLDARPICCQGNSTTLRVDALAGRHRCALVRIRMF